MTYIILSLVAGGVARAFVGTGLGPVGPFLIGPTHSETLRMPVDIRILRQWSDKYKLPHPLALVHAHLSFHP